MTIRVFINEQTVSVPDGSDVKSAVTTFDESLGDAVSTGRAYVTDGVGRRVEHGSAVQTGDILRVVISARRFAADGTSA